VFGSSGAGTFLGKLTATVAIIFMLTSLTLAYLATKGSSSIVDRSNVPAAQQETMPAAPDAAQLPAIPSPGKAPDKK